MKKSNSRSKTLNNKVGGCDCIEKINNINPHIICFANIISYGVLGVLWILLSEKILYYLTDNYMLYKQMLIYKDWLYVFVIILLTYALDNERMRHTENTDYKILETHIQPSILSINPSNLMEKTNDKKKVISENKYFYNQITEYLQKNKVEHIQMSKKLHIGIDNKEFKVYYQPQFNLYTGEIVGMEALIRWMHIGEGFISPTKFIPIAEETGQIYAIERLVIESALQQKKKWEDEGYKQIELSINLSSKTLTSDNNFRKLDNLLSTYDVNYRKITMEITETAIISNVDLVNERLNKLKNKGFKIALDDFGTGYSSLTYLKKFPIDIIKLDRSFINLIPQNSIDMVIIRHILSMAQDLKYQVVAEGIETHEQLEYLKQHSCDMGQGFLLSKPMAEDKVNELLKSTFVI